MLPRRNVCSERIGECDMQFEWATRSGNYANFAGILAGFVFSGIFLFLIVLYNTQLHLMDIPIFVDQVIMGMFRVNMMINNFSIDHEYRMMQLLNKKMSVLCLFGDFYFDF